MALDFENLGIGCGFRPDHETSLTTAKSTGVDWLEILVENFLPWPDGREQASANVLEKLRRDYPMALHGVSLSLGSTDPLNRAHVRRVRALLERVEASWFSDHLCWTGVGGVNLHDLLPLPYTEQALRHVVERIVQVQELLGRRFVVENLSSYVSFEQAEMTEWEFLSEVAKRADCGLLLDINNVYVSSRNHGFDPMDYLRAVDPSRVVQVHLAGHDDQGDIVLDTHDRHVREEVWCLYEWACRAWGTPTTLVEWDDNLPPFPVLEKEVARARARAQGTQRNDSAGIAKTI